MRSIRTLLPVLLASLVLAAPALGQGTSGTFPDPISSRELARIAQRVDLSAEQRLALDGDHVTYLDAFTEVRDGPIAAYLEEAGSMWRMMMSEPDAAAARRTINDLDKIAARIRRLDENLFDQLQTVLSPDQVELMPLVRDERERTRNRAGLVRFVVSGNPSMRVDFATIIADAQLTPDESAEVAPLLLDYEMQLTSLTRRLQSKTHDGFVKLVESLEEATAEGQDGRGRWNMMRSLFNDASKDSLAVADDIAQLNNRFHQQLQALLGDRSRDEVRTAFLRAAYPDVYRAFTETLPRYDAALTLTDLDAEERTAIEAGRDDLTARLEPLGQRMIETQDALRQKGGRWRFGGEDVPEQQRMEELNEQAEAMNEEARDRLAALLGADRMQALRAVLPEDPDADGAMTAMPGRAPSASSSSSAQANGAAIASNRADPYVPGPITEQQIEQYARWMGLDDSNTALLGGLHLDYLDAYDVVRDEHVDSVVAANQALWSLDDSSGNIAGPDAERVTELFAMRAAAVDAVAGADKAFFDGVEITLGADDRATRGVMRARLARQRERCTVDRSGGSGIRPASSWLSRLRTDGPSEADVDVTGMIDAIAPDTVEDEEAAIILVRWERDVAPIVKERYRITLELDEDMQRLNAAMTAARGDRRHTGAIFGRSGYRERLETTGPRLRKLRSDAIEVSRQTVAALEPILSSVENAAIERAYREAAHPAIYDDPESPEGDLLRALAMDGLRPDQRESLSETLAEYRGPYVELCEKMVELDKTEPDGWAERRAQRQALERLRFERSELNQRTRRRVEFLLDDDQRERLTGP